ncbi:MAG: Ig-like domain-containing protein [Pseudomonadota bacterium]
MNSDGSYSYDPNGAFKSVALNTSTSDQVNFTVSDGVASPVSGVLNVTVRGTNDAPQANDDTDIETNANAAVEDNVLDNDEDPDNGAVLRVSAVDGNAGKVGQEFALASGALVTLASDGSFRFDPNGAYPLLNRDDTVEEEIAYTIADEFGASSSAVITVTITGQGIAPDAKNDGISVNEDTGATGNVFANNGAGIDSDANGDAFTVTAVNGQALNVGSPVVLSGGASVVVLATGQVTVATNSSYDSLAVGDTAQETFNYTITDSTGLSDTATVTLTINGVNDAPTAQNDAVPVSQDGSANGNVLGNNGNGVDSDIDDGDMLSVTAVNAMAGDVGQTIDLSGGGTLVIMSNGMFSFNTDGDFASLAAGQMVTTSASYTIEDDAGTPDTAVITFTVTGANDAPTAADDSFSGTKNSPITGNLLSNNGLGADSDIDTGDSIRVVAIVVDGSTVETPITSPITLPSGAVISINPDGSFSYDASAAASLTPIIGTPAVDGFDYIIEDNAGLSSRARASFSLSTSVNQPVDARDDDITTDANTPIVVDLFANNGNGPDTDPEGDSFEIVAVNGQAGNVNAPLFLLEGGVLTVESDGRARFTPDGDFEDLDVGDQDDFSATYTVRDSEGNISVAAINIFVDGVNDAPEAEDDFFFGNDEEITTGNVFDQNGGGEDSDPEGQMLRVTKVNNVAIPGDGSPITLASGALLTIDAEGNFSYDPNGAFSLGLTENESDTFSYTIVDTGGLESTASVDINLVAVVPPADLLVSEISGDGGDAYTQTGLSYTLTNNGPGPASRFAENVYLSSDAILDENDALVRTFESGVVLEAGESLTRNFSARLPREAGEYFILVDVDPEDRVEETDEANLFASANTITVEPAYTVSLQASTDTALASDTITLSGRATLSDNVSAAPFALVEIDVRDGGEQELIYAFTDADGFWSQDFTPRDGAAGTHTFNARYPGAVTEDSAPEASVEFLDIFVTAPSQAVPVIAGDPAVTFTVDVTNPTDIDLTGIDVVLTGVDAPVNAQIIGAPTELAPGESANIEISLTAPADAAAAIEIFSVDVTSDQGAADSQLAGVEVVPLLGQLELSIDSIDQVIVRDRQEIITFDVTNVGAADTGPVTIALPSLPFLSNGGSAIIDNLMPGESAEVSLIVSPADDLPLGEYEGSIALISEDSSVNLDFDFTALSEATGTLEVRLADDFTYFADGEPLVEDASVTVRNAVSGEVVFESDDVDEILTLEDLPEGFYDIEVSAEDHEPFKATIETKAGETTQIEAFMRLETVRTSWNVQEVAFEDRYEITVEADFLTNVPAPVVVVEPGDVDISQLENIGDTMTVTFTATNHGLIGVQDFELDFGEHPLYDIDVPFDSIPNLEAQSSISFEVTFTRTGDLPGETQQQLALAPAGFDDDAAELLADFDFGAGGTSVNTDVQFTSVPCNIPASTRYKYECGPYGIEVTDTIVVNGVEGNCFGIQGLGEFISGLGGGGGGGGGGRRTGGFDLGFVIPLGEGERAEQVPYSSFSLPDLTFTTCDLSNAADILSSLVPHPVLSCALSILSKYVIGNSLIDILYEKTVEQIESAIEDGITDAVAKIVFKRVPKSVRDKITDAVDPEDFAKQVRELRDRVKQAAEAVDQASSALSSESSAEASSLAVPASLAALALTVPLDAQAAPQANVQQLSADGIDVFLPPEPEDALAKLLELQDAYDAAYITLMGEELFQLAVDGDDAVIDFYNDLVLLSLTDEGPAALSLDLSNQLIEKYAGLIDPVVMQDAIARWNRSVEYSEAGYMNASDVPDGLSTDFASTDDFVAALSIVQEINDDVEDLGYSSVSEYFNDLLDIANPPPTHDDGVCATVRIQINQEAVLTRQAFEGTLEIENLLDGDLTDVQFDLEIRDASGNVVDMDVFAVLEPELSGVSAIDGSGVIDSGNTGTIKFTVIPGRDAAMDEETVYTLGGTLSYTAGDNVVTTPLLGAPITVLPQPELELDYFLQRNVFSDDPFTDEIEPFEPFALGLLVRNEGAGAATDLSITSAQPKIIENEKGLLIDFDIIGTKVNGENLSPSLEVDFGDIAPDSSATATFLMTSSLQGRFVDYDVSFEHVNAFGNVDLSLITETRIHELIRLVKDDRPGADDLEDFLVNGNADVDLNGNPDTLHLSDGTIEAVASARDEMITTPLANGEAQFSAEAEVGWNYFELDDPSNGTANVVGIERSDGKVLTADNFWVTDRTFPPTGNPVYEFRLKVLDFVPAEGPVSYTVLFADKPVPPAADDDVFEILSLAPAQLDVLDNDEPDVRIVDVTQGEFGQVRLLGNGNIEYTPNGQTEQLDSFSYIVEDTQGGRSSAQVSVQQIQPVEISGPASIDEGSDYVLNLDVAPGADPGLKLEIDWGDGSDVEEFSLTQTVSHTYEDGDAAVNITATLIDGDIRSDVGSIAVQVSNVAPMGDVSGNETAIAGQSYQLDIGPITDPGDDTITEYRIAWGDGSPDLVVQVEGGVVPDFETHVYQSAGEFKATVSVTDEDGTFVLGSQDVAVQEIVSEPVVVRLGDQPDRINFFTLPAFAAAWTDPDITITHRDDYNNDLDLNTWTDAIPTVFGGQILAGGDLFVGNLGVSGRSAGIEQAQLLDGTEALRFELANEAQSVELEFFSFGQDGDRLEAARVELFDRDGNKVGEEIISANSDGSALQVLISANENFSQVVISSGAYDEAGTFVAGAYIDEAGFAQAATSTLPGSTFALDYVEFTFPGAPLTAGFAAQMLEMEALSDVADAGSTLGDDDDIGTPFSFVNDSLFEF